MYNVYNESDEKVFGCSSLPAVIEYMVEVCVVSVTVQRDVRIDLVNGEHIVLTFGCPTSAHDWIVKHVPGTLVKVKSGKGGCVYSYEEC